MLRTVQPAPSPAESASAGANVIFLSPPGYYGSFKSPEDVEMNLESLEPQGTTQPELSTLIPIDFNEKELNTCLILPLKSMGIKGA